MFEWLASPEAWVALATLTALEIVLGIDNIIFISILVGRLPEHQRQIGRQVGLGLAMIARLALLFSISWVMGLTEPWFSVFGHPVSGRDLILVGGGLFLLAKSTHEIHNSLEGEEEHGHDQTGAAALGSILVQIALLDIVYKEECFCIRPLSPYFCLKGMPCVSALGAIPISFFIFIIPVFIECGVFAYY
jgi:predicted tellurium resistance membrane protein TerC